MTWLELLDVLAKIAVVSIFVVLLAALVVSAVRTMRGK